MNGKLLRVFVELVKARLQGDWVVIGGSVLPLLGVDHRVTLDIDLAGPPESTQTDTLRLMEIATELRLPPEAINQAGAFFLRQIKAWKENIVLFAETKKCRIYRPNCCLYIKLKMDRLSESDLADCIKMIRLEPPSSRERKELIALLKKPLKNRGESRQEGIRRLIEVLREDLRFAREKNE